MNFSHNALQSTLQQESIMPRRDSSLTGVYERRIRAFSQKERGDYISALISFRHVLRISKHHLRAPPFLCSRDVAIAHNDIAGVLDEIILRLNDTDEAAMRTYINIRS